MSEITVAGSFFYDALGEFIIDFTAEKLSGVLKCITENADVEGFTVAEYIPFDEYKLHKMLADIKIFSA